MASAFPLESSSPCHFRYTFRSSGKITFHCEHRANECKQLWFQKWFLQGHHPSSPEKKQASEFNEFLCLLGCSQIAGLSREDWGLKHLLLAISHSFIYYWNSILAMTSWRREVSEIALSRKMRVDGFLHKYVRARTSVNPG